MNFLLNLYGNTLEIASPALKWLLGRRLAKGKEDGARILERRGLASLKRPKGKLIWIHGASVGEAQSTLIIIAHIKRQFPDASILLTTGTVTSATYLATRLPAGVIHQYYPLDRPRWVKNFLAHWMPDYVLWMESELWPAMLCALQKQKTPVMLLNARLSPRSQERWQYFAGTAHILLRTFSKILTQTETDAHAFRTLGAQNVSVSGNLKYAAAALSADESDLRVLKSVTQGRPLWLYASTHKGEEELACRLHQKLSAGIPGLLTVIVPRHPERRADIQTTCEHSHMLFRGDDKKLPTDDTQIYIADTLGELGLFYRLAPIACIGRSFSADGGGGHNPVEAAQLGCAVLHGPHVQNLREIYRDMDQAGAAKLVMNEGDFATSLKTLLSEPAQQQALAHTGLNFTQAQGAVLENTLAHVLPGIAAVMA